MGRTDVLTRRDYEASLGWIRHFFNESEMAPNLSASQLCARNCLTPPALSETRFIANDCVNSSPCLETFEHCCLRSWPSRRPFARVFPRLKLTSDNGWNTLWT